MAAVPGPLAAADLDILHWLVTHRSPTWTGLATKLMDVGLNLGFLALTMLVVLVLAVVLRVVRPVVAAGAAALLAAAVSLVLKDLIARPRPGAALALVRAAGYSMPSTDSALVAALTVALVLGVTWRSQAWQRAAWTVAIPANLLMGLALVYLGVHWTTDVLAGWALGGAVGSAVGVLAQRRAPRRPGRRRSR